MPASADIMTWILTRATEQSDPLQLLEGLLKRLLDSGVPILRLSLGISTIDPELRGLSMTAWRGRPSTVDEASNDAQGEASFQRSPIFYAQSRSLLAHRWRLDGPAEIDDLPLLQTLKRDGATDFVLRLVPFGEGGISVRGAAFSFTTDRPGGFEDAHLRLFSELLPALGLAAKCYSSARTANEALRVYLGPRTGQRVLAGEIQRGKGQRMSAAVLIADLRGFTALTDREDALRVVGWLDEHFELIGTAIDEHGGEVLKFLGDGLLAIFPFEADSSAGIEACDRAIAAAEQALGNTERLNAGRELRGEPRLDLDVVLHAGEVVYGNVGASRRLDFTVIGSAVNEASRMEDHCKAMNRNLLMSETFAQLCSCPTVSIGVVELRGVSGRKVICAPAEP